MGNPDDVFLRSMKLCFETGPAVVSALLEHKVLPHYMDLFEEFLKNTKHKIFHQKNPKVKCCECQSTSCLNNVKLNLRQFQFFYIFNKKKKHKGQNSKPKKKDFAICLCQYSAKILILDDLDLTLLAQVATVSGRLEQYQEEWISNLKDQRNKLCHLSKISTLPIAYLDQIWTETTDIISKIAGLIPGVCFRKSIEREIDNLKARIFSPQQSADVVNTHFKECLDELPTNEELEDKKDKIEDETVSLSEGDSTRLLVENCGKVFALVGFSGQPAKEIETGILKQTANDNNILHDNDDEDRDITCTCIVSGEAVDTREDIIYERLKHPKWEKADSEGGVFQFLDAEKHCILLHLKVRQSILQDSSKLHSAIRSLLQTIITAGDIAHNVPAFLVFQFDSHQITVNDLHKILRQEDEPIDVCQPIIGQVMQVIFGLFPDIVRDWLMNYYNMEELMAELSTKESLPAILTDQSSLFESPLEKLYEICTKLKKIQPPRSGWGTLSKITDKTPSDDVVRMVFLARRIKCRPNAKFTEDERDQIMVESRNIAARFDQLLKKQHYFEKRLIHLSNEWGFVEHVQSGLKKYELSSVHHRTHTSEIVYQVSSPLDVGESTWSLDSGISVDQSKQPGHQAGLGPSRRMPLEKKSLHKSPSALKEQSIIQMEDVHLTAKQSAKLQKMKAGEQPQTFPKMKSDRISSLSAIAEDGEKVSRDDTDF